MVIDSSPKRRGGDRAVQLRRTSLRFRARPSCVEKRAIAPGLGFRVSGLGCRVWWLRELPMELVT